MDTVRIDLDWSYGYSSEPGTPKKLYGPGRVDVPIGLARALGRDVDALLAAETIQGVDDETDGIGEGESLGGMSYPPGSTPLEPSSLGDGIVTTQTLDNIVVEETAVPVKRTRKRTK